MKRAFRVSAGLLSLAVAAVIIPQSLAATRAASAQDASPEETAIIQHLNAAVTWYKQLAAANESAGQPSDLFYLENGRALAQQALQFAFQSAEAQAALLLTEKREEAASAGPVLSSNEQQQFSKSAADTAALIKQTEAQIQKLNTQIPNVSAKKLQELTAQRDSLQEQLDFDKVLLEALQKLTTFMSGGGGRAGGLQQEIDNLKKSVPDVFAKVPAKGATPAPLSPPPNEASGLISQAAFLFSRLGDLRELDRIIDGATTVSAMARRVQSPLRAQLRATVEEGRSLANQPPPQDPASMEAFRRKMTSITAQFKHISNTTLPLTQEIYLLDESQASLRQWDAVVDKGYAHVAESVVIRILILLIGIGIVLGLSEVWRRATFRYVREARRRHQVLLLRRFVTGILLALVLVMGFVSEFGSLATFAGFLTAGIAVALQTIILSVAAYFFLLGRHGIRVGDRISVSGVTGDVIDVGLVRLSLMELGGSGSDVHPTGRLVVVSNSVLFQGTLFKQIPGTAYTWHELNIRLQNGSDYAMAEEKMLEAVSSIYAQYRDSLLQQQQVLEGFMAISSSVPSPQASLQLGANGLDLVVRYPVVLHRETEIDNQIAKRVVEVIDRDPVLKAAVGSPTIRPSFKP